MNVPDRQALLYGFLAVLLALGIGLGLVLVARM